MVPVFALIMGQLGGLIFLMFCIPGVTSSPEEYALITSLMKSYDVNVRPVESQGDQVVVKIGMAVNQLIDMNERYQTLKISVWSRLYWTDANLRWNKTEYDLESIRLSPGRIWTPDITLYSDVSETSPNLQRYIATVSHTGDVSWLAPIIFTSYCKLEMKYFPWDQQICSLKFGSWSYDGSKMDLMNRSASGDTSSYMNNGEWDIVDIPVRRHVLYYACCKEPYPDVTFYLVLRRRPLYFLFNLVLPCIFITATTALVFYLPPESGEKVSLSVTVLLALTVFLLMVAEIMPPQSEVIPLIAQYFGATIILMALSTSLTVVVLNLHHRGTFSNPVPRWLRFTVLQGLGTALGMRRIIDENASEASSNKVNKAVPALSVGDLPTNIGNIQNGLQDVEKQSDMSTSDAILMQILHIMQEEKRHRAEEKKTQANQSDWILVAMVLDRFMMVIFIIITIIVTTVVLTQHPTYSDHVSVD